MHTLVVFAAIIAVAVGGQVVSVSQGALGDYNLKYATDSMARVEHRNIFGQVDGGYSYVDPYGLVNKVSYRADEHGFRTIANNIPLPVQDTPEVALAKAEHFLRKAEATPLIHRVVETPVVRSSYIEAVPFETAPLVRIAAVPESPAVLELESNQFAAHVARKNHFLI